MPVENFYEWRPADRQPFAVALKDRQLMALAAIWDFWISPQGEQTLCFALITTPAHAVLAPFCAQMPVMVPPSELGAVARSRYRWGRSFGAYSMPSRRNSKSGRWTAASPISATTILPCCLPGNIKPKTKEQRAKRSN